MSKPPLTDVLYLRYSDVCEAPSDINEHLPTFVNLVHKLQAKNVVELGTRSGVSTIAWLFALEEQGGHLWSVDIDPQPRIGTYDHWTFIQGDDCSGEVFTQMPAQADIVFIDTSHEYEHTCRELNLYRWLVRKGGVIVLHDTELAYPEFVVGKPFPVKRAVEEFCRSEGFDVEWHTNCWGLAIIHVR
jgi:predicted O-methyltransferase YrrM